MDGGKKIFDIAPAAPKVSKPKQAEKKPVVADEDSALSIPVRTSMLAGKSSEPSEEAEPKSPEVHHELKLAVPDQTDEPPQEAEVAAVPEQDSAEESVDETKTSNDVSEPVVTAEAQNSVADESVAAEAQDSVLSEEAVLGDPESSQATDDMQHPKVFDTKQYHLPIKNSKTHNAGRHMLVFCIVFLLAVAVGGAIAIDAGWLDLGFRLPFDLIK